MTILTKIILVFGVGFLETLLYTMYLISIDNRKLMHSTVLTFLYMSTYLMILAYSFKDINSTLLITIYAFSSALGNWVVVNRDKNRDLTTFKHKHTHPHHSPKKKAR